MAPCPPTATNPTPSRKLQFSGYRIPDIGSWYRISDPIYRVPDIGYRILDIGSRISDPDESMNQSINRSVDRSTDKKTTRILPIDGDRIPTASGLCMSHVGNGECGSGKGMWSRRSDLGSWISDFGSRISGIGSRISGPRSRIPDSR